MLPRSSRSGVEYSPRSSSSRGRDVVAAAGADRWNVSPGVGTVTAPNSQITQHVGVIAKLEEFLAAADPSPPIPLATTLWTPRAGAERPRRSCRVVGARGPVGPAVGEILVPLGAGEVAAGGRAGDARPRGLVDVPAHQAGAIEGEERFAVGTRERRAKRSPGREEVTDRLTRGDVEHLGTCIAAVRGDDHGPAGRDVHGHDRYLKADDGRSDRLPGGEVDEVDGAGVVRGHERAGWSVDREVGVGDDVADLVAGVWIEGEGLPGVEA